VVALLFTLLLRDILQLDGDHEGADEDSHLYEAIQLDPWVLFSFFFRWWFSTSSYLVAVTLA
jgi:hypothetical protein